MHPSSHGTYHDSFGAGHLPALIAYNYFVRKTERLVDEIDLVTYDLIETAEGPSVDS